MTTTMNGTRVPIETAPTAGSPPMSAPRETGSGWLMFAGTVLGLAGFMRIIDAWWAFVYKGSLPDNLQNALFGSHLSTYAWTWLIVGVVLLASSFLLLMGSHFARWIGFFAATVGALSAMTWMP